MRISNCNIKKNRQFADVEGRVRPRGSQHNDGRSGPSAQRVPIVSVQQGAGTRLRDYGQNEQAQQRSRSFRQGENTGEEAEAEEKVQNGQIQLRSESVSPCQLASQTD